jgi:hypothetical protein
VTNDPGDGGFSWGLRPRGTDGEPDPQAPEDATAPEQAPNPASTVQPAPATLPAEQQPAAESAPAPSEPLLAPTEPLSWGEFAATQQQAPMPETDPLEQPTEAYTVLPWQPAAPVNYPADAGSPGATSDGSGDPAYLADADAHVDKTSAIDSLFADQHFEEFEEVGVLKTIQVLPAAADAPVEREPRAPLSTPQKILMGVAGGLVAVLILLGLFFLGRHLGEASAQTPVPVKTHGATAVPTPAGTGGPATAGTQQWSALQGGECIQSFSSAWAQTFEVVPCTSDHGAEMVFKGTLPDNAQTAYPSTASFKTQLIALCSAPTAINYATAAAVTDLQVSFSYPANTAAWLAGDRTYYCFVNRASGGNLTGDLAVPKTSGGQ